MFLAREVNVSEPNPTTDDASPTDNRITVEDLVEKSRRLLSKSLDRHDTERINACAYALDVLARTQPPAPSLLAEPDLEAGLVNRSEEFRVARIQAFQAGWSARKLATGTEVLPAFRAALAAFLDRPAASPAGIESGLAIEERIVAAFDSICRRISDMEPGDRVVIERTIAGFVWSWR